MAAIPRVTLPSLDGSMSSTVIPSRTAFTRVTPSYVACLTVGTRCSYSTEEYGSRYSRPDRFAQVRRPSVADRTIPVDEWLLSLSNRVEKLCADVESPASLPRGSKNQRNASVEEEIDVRILRTHANLLRAGRLEECLDLLRSTVPSPTSAMAAVKPLELTVYDSDRDLNHIGFLLAALDGGSVDLAFEYAGTLPPSISAYNVLLGAIILANHEAALDLPLNTARQRGLSLDRLSFSLLIWDALRKGNSNAVETIYQKSLSEDIFPKSIILEDLVKVLS